ncbi:MAG: hypothetical protein AB7D02_02330 [Candidatus Paceibacterota bacterium]
MKKRIRIQIIALSTVLAVFIGLVLFFGISYKKKVEEGLLQAQEISKKLIEFKEFIKENQKYISESADNLVLSEHDLNERNKIAQRGYDLFLSYFSFYLLAFPKNQLTGVREAICVLSQEGANKIYGTGINCYQMPTLSFVKEGDYLMVGISLNDLLERWSPDYNKNEKYSFCVLVTPFIEDPVMERVENKLLIKNFNEGKVICQTEVLMNQPQTFLVSGMMKKGLSLDLFLVNQTTLEEIKKIDSFEKAQEILNKNLLLWSKR